MLRQHAFQIVIFLATAVILSSCFITHRALDDLPESNQRIVASEDQLIRIGNLKSVLGTAISRLRALSWDGDEQDRTDLSEALARGGQLIEDLANHQSTETLTRMLELCGDHIAEIRSLIPVTKATTSAEQSRLRAQSRILISGLASEISAEQENLAKTKTEADLERREATWALFGGHGLMLGVIGLLYLARRTEKKLRLDADRRTLEADERFALIVRGTADGIVLTDGIGRVQMVNPAACEMFHASGDELQGKPIGSLFATTAIEEWLANRIDGSDAGLSRTVLAKRDDGSEFIAELTISPSVVHQQEFLAISVRDISERRAIADAIEAT